MITHKTDVLQREAGFAHSGSGMSPTITVPDYLEKTYWWAYTHPNAVRVFERQWLVNLILWGNFAHLRDLALDELGQTIRGRTLQVACVYGNFTEKIVQRLAPDAHLDVVDVAPVQIQNMHAKLQNKQQVSIQQQNAAHLQFESASHDQVVVFFLLHEMPLDVRLKTVAEAWRVTKPGGKMVFVDYHQPDAINPFRYIMMPILGLLEPFAMDLWHTDIQQWLPAGTKPSQIDKQTYFGGLYQKVVITR
jgi:ubiquinone/menaquinone biosynthesis C-methylase UbiE